MVQFLARGLRCLNRYNGALSLLLSTALVIATILLWVSTARLANESRKASQGQLLVTINRDVFLSDRLYNVRKAIESGTPILTKNGGALAEQDVDDYIGFFDLLQSLIRQDVLAWDLVADNFCEFAEDAYGNKEIQVYISELRKKPRSADVETDFEEFAKRCAAKK